MVTITLNTLQVLENHKQAFFILYIYMYIYSLHESSYSYKLYIQKLLRSTSYASNGVFGESKMKTIMFWLDLPS